MIKLNKKGSILLISSWILLILVILAIGLGYRSSIALRLSAYQKDSLKAFYVAKAGINQAIVQLKNDAITNPFYNSLQSPWSTGIDPLTKNSLFNNMDIGDGKIYLCIMDEERKININKAVADHLGQLILVRLFNSAGVADADVLKNLTVKWIDSVDDKDEDPERIFKNSELRTMEELLLILEYFYRVESSPSLKAKEIYGMIKDFITVHGDGKVNINTASKEILEILVSSCIDECINNGTINVRPDSQNLINLISTLREDDPFENPAALSSALGSGNLSSEERNVLTKLTSIITFKSDNFFISSMGEIIGKDISKTITCVFSRTTDKIVYWHEN